MTDKEKLDRMKKLADGMYYAAQYLTTDASRLRKAMDEYHKFIIYEYNKQDPASPCENCEGNGLPGTCASISSLGRCPLEYNKEPASEDLEQAAEQAEQREGNLINGRFKAGFKSGAQWQKEQLLKDAVIIDDELVMCYNNGEPMGLSPYKEWWDTPEVQSRFTDGDKVKVIIVKDND